MRDIFTELAASWDGGCAASLAVRPVPVRRPHRGQLPSGAPSAPARGQSWFDVLSARAPGHIADGVRQREHARRDGPPVLHVHVGSLSSPVSRYEVDPGARTVAFTVSGPPEPDTRELPAVTYEESPWMPGDARWWGG